ISSTSSSITGWCSYCLLLSFAIAHPRTLEREGLNAFRHGVLIQFLLLQFNPGFFRPDLETMHQAHQHGALLEPDHGTQLRRQQQTAAAIHVHLHRLTKEAALEFAYLRAGIALRRDLAGNVVPGGKGV